MSEYGKIITDERGIVDIKNLPYYWKIKIEKWRCPFCGTNKLLKKENETNGKYVECIQCGRAYQ